MTDETQKNNKPDIREHRFMRFGDGLKEEVHQPHDRFLKRSLKERQVCLELFNRELTTEFKNMVDLEAYELVHTSHINDSLNAHFTDALFKFPIKGREEVAYSYLLFEGARKAESDLALRLHGYLLDIIQDHQSIYKTNKIPFIQTLVFYNGVEPFEGPLSLKDQIDAPPELAATMFDNFRVLNIKTEDDTRFHEDLWYGFMALAMKHIDDEDIFVFIQEYSARILEIKDNDGNRWMRSVVRYLFSKAQKRYNERELVAAIQQLESDIQEDFMTYAQMFEEIGIKKGIEQGIEQGIEKGVIKTARAMFSKGLDLDLVKSVTNLSDDILKPLMQQSPRLSS